MRRAGDVVLMEADMPDTDAPAPVPTVRSLKQWGVAKETRDGKITVTMTLTDPAEAGAWAVWLLAHAPALDPREPGQTLARTRTKKSPGPRMPVEPGLLTFRWEIGRRLLGDLPGSRIGGNWHSRGRRTPSQLPHYVPQGFEQVKFGDVNGAASPFPDGNPTSTTTGGTGPKGMQS